MRVESFIGQSIDFYPSLCTAEQIQSAHTSRFPSIQKSCNSRKYFVSNAGALVVEPCFTWHLPKTYLDELVREGAVKPDARGTIDGLPHERRGEAGVDGRHALSPHHVHEKRREARLLCIRRHGS